jgi:thiamine-phosphate pyrophosphorylase
LILPRLYPLVDTGLLAERGFPVEPFAEAILDAGARLLQLRHKGPYTRNDFAMALRLASLSESAGALFVVNDRADIARLTGAALHLGQHDLPASAARKLLGPTAPIGLSTHNETQIRAAASDPVDYLALGPFFPTASKQNPDPVVGPTEFTRLRSLTSRPLVAIGGITRANALKAIVAGADSVAVISDLIPDELTPRAVRARTDEWLQLLKT